MVDSPRSSRRGPTAKDLLKDWGAVAKLQDAQLDDLQEIYRQLDESKTDISGEASPHAESELLLAQDNSETGEQEPASLSDILGVLVDPSHTRVSLDETRHEELCRELEMYSSALQVVLDNYGAISEQMNSVHGNYESVTNKTNEINTAATSLLDEKNSMLTAADDLRRKLEYFNDAARISQRLNAAGAAATGRSGSLTPEKRGSDLSVLSEEFENLVNRLDSCAEQMELMEKASYHDASRYLLIFRAARRRAIHLVVKQFGRALLSLTPSGSVSGASTPRNSAAANLDAPIADAQESTLIEFRALAVLWRPLFQMVEDKAENISAYEELMATCFKHYQECRDKLLRNDLEKYVKSLATTKPLPELIRFSCAHLTKLCSIEHSLFQEFFADAEKGTQVIDTFLKSMCDILYSVLRPAIIHEADMDVLCDVMNILETEVTHDQILPRGKEVAAFASTIADVIEDVQERLLYRAEVYIRENVVNYKYTEDDFNYPAVLQPELPQSDTDTLANGEASNESHSPQPSSLATSNQDATSQLDGELGPSASQAPQTQLGDKSRVATLRASEGSSRSRSSSTSSTSSPFGKRTSVASIPTLPQQKSPAKRHTWCPVLEKSLLCLSKMYRCVEKSVFEYVAHVAVHHTVVVLEKIASVISQRSSRSDGQLFLIKHLLILREQILPFEVDFSHTEKNLDFSHMTGMLRGVFTGRTSFRQLVFRSIPTITETHPDAKKAMELVLKRTCEDFIKTETNALVRPMSGILSQIAASKVPRSTDATADVRPSVQSIPGDVIDKVIADIEGSLYNQALELTRRMSLYLENPVTERILFRPILMSVFASMDQLKLHVDATYTGSDRRPDLNALFRVREQLNHLFV